MRQKQVARSEPAKQRRPRLLQKHEAVRQKGLLVVSHRPGRSLREEALTQAAKADAINRFLIDKAVAPGRPGEQPGRQKVTLLEVLDHAAAEVGTSFGGQPEIEAAIRLAIGQTYHDLGDYPKSTAHYRAAYEIYKRTSDETDPDRLKAMADWGTASFTRPPGRGRAVAGRRSRAGQSPAGADP